LETFFQSVAKMSTIVVSSANSSAQVLVSENDRSFT